MSGVGRRLSRAMTFLPSKLISTVKNLSRDEIDILVRSCTSQKSERIDPALLKQLASVTNSEERFQAVLQALWKRINDKGYELHILKGLQVYLYLIQHGEYAHKFFEAGKQRLAQIEILVRKYNFVLMSEKVAIKIRDTARLLYDLLSGGSVQQQRVSPRPRRLNRMQSMHSLPREKSLNRVFTRDDITLSAKKVPESSVSRFFAELTTAAADDDLVPKPSTGEEDLPAHRSQEELSRIGRSIMNGVLFGSPESANTAAAPEVDEDGFVTQAQIQRNERKNLSAKARRILGEDPHAAAFLSPKAVRSSATQENIAMDMPSLDDDAPPVTLSPSRPRRFGSSASIESASEWELSEILQDPQLRSLFIRFCAQPTQSKQHLLMFWMETQQYQYVEGDQHRLEAAQAIFNRYIAKRKANITTRIDFSADAQKALQRNLRIRPVPKDAFSEAVREVELILSGKTFTSFVRTKAFHRVIARRRQQVADNASRPETRANTFEFKSPSSVSIHSGRVESHSDLTRFQPDITSNEDGENMHDDFLPKTLFELFRQIQIPRTFATKLLRQGITVQDVVSCSYEDVKVLLNHPRYEQLLQQWISQYRAEHPFFKASTARKRILRQKLAKSHSLSQRDLFSRQRSISTHHPTATHHTALPTIASVEVGSDSDSDSSSGPDALLSPASRKRVLQRRQFSSRNLREQKQYDLLQMKLKKSLRQLEVDASRPSPPGTPPAAPRAESTPTPPSNTHRNTTPSSLSKSRSSTSTLSSLKKRIGLQREPSFDMPQDIPTTMPSKASKFFGVQVHSARQTRAMRERNKPRIASDVVNASHCAVSSELSEEERHHREMQREKVLAEIVESEEKYVASIDALIHNYVTPLRDPAFRRSLGLTVEDVHKLFSNIEMIVNFHKVLLMDLKTDPNMGKTFVKNAPYLKVYTQYIAAYDACLQTANTLLNNPAFQSWLTSVRERSNGALDIMSYLIMPVQRIPRYELLLREVIKNTPHDHPEHKELCQAFDLIQEVAKHINEKKRENENMSKILEILNEMYDTPDDLVILKPNRSLVREGRLHYRSKGVLNYIKECRCFLFNDLFFYTNSSGKFKGHFSLSGCVVDDYFVDRICFNLRQHHAAKPLTLFCTSEEEKEDWMRDFNICISQCYDLEEPLLCT